jgi:hypothetical protein
MPDINHAPVSAADSSLTVEPDRKAEAEGRLICHRCGARAWWYPHGDAWVPACAEHAPENDST